MVAATITNEHSSVVLCVVVGVAVAVAIVVVVVHYSSPWWSHQMETFSVLLAICAGNSPVPGEFTAQRPVTWNFNVFFDLRPNKLLSKQSWRWWFETSSCPLWRHCNAVDSCDPFTHILQGCFIDLGSIIWLFQWQSSNLKGHGKSSTTNS